MTTPKDKMDSADTPEPAVPKAVVGRLSLYLRELQRLAAEGHETTSSTQLGKLLGVTDAQVRKDLAYFGQFGYPGVGYRCQELIQQIKRILGTDRQWAVALVGAGNLGRALLRYRGFAQQGFHLVAAFDVAPDKVGSTVEGIPVYGLDKLQEVVQQKQIKLAMLAVPASDCQAVADRLVAAGITGILNFAPATLTVPPEVSVVAVDLARELEQLSFAVVKQLEKT